MRYLMTAASWSASTGALQALSENFAPPAFPHLDTLVLKPNTRQMHVIASLCRHWPLNCKPRLVSSLCKLCEIAPEVPATFQHVPELARSARTRLHASVSPLHLAPPRWDSGAGEAEAPECCSAQHPRASLCIPASVRRLEGLGARSKEMLQPDMTLCLCEVHRPGTSPVLALQICP